jgi:hypothetical protein
MKFRGSHAAKQEIAHDLGMRIAKELAAYPDIAAIYLFGSVATGRANIAVHEYQELNISLLGTILTSHLKDIEDFYAAIVNHFRVNE